MPRTVASSIPRFGPRRGEPKCREVHGSWCFARDERTLPLSNLTEASERDLYWEWVRAEVDIPVGSPRYNDRLGHGLDEGRLLLLAQGEREKLSEEDWDALRIAYRRLRGDYLDPLLGLDTRWFYGDLPVAELPDVRIPNLTISFVPIAPSRRLAEFVAALDSGKETTNLPNHLIYRHMRPVFDSVRARGCPILIAERREGPYVLAEGLTRTCVVLSLALHGESTPAALRVLLGLSARAHDWPWF